MIIPCLNWGVQIGVNVWAVVDYVLEDEDGEVLDDSTAEDGEPLQYVHGYGMLVPGLEKRLLGLEQGEKADIIVQPEEAYGLHDDELVYVIDREAAPRVSEGDEVVLENEEGEERVAHVIEVGPVDLTVDGNHPLAGMTLRYRVTVREVREATADELERAARAFDEDRDELEPPDPALVPLLSLHRRKDERPN